MTDALISHRDGIVGNWLGQTLFPSQRIIENPANLAAWDPVVRGCVIDFDLLSHLHFTQHKETFTYVDNGTTVTKTTSNRRSVTLWHLHVRNVPPAPKVTSSRVMTVIRPTPAILKKQLEFMDSYSDLRGDRASEILSELTPQYAFWSSVAYLHPDRTRKTIELLDAALRLATYVEMRIKHALAVRRPNELSSQVQPIILTPGHASFPSGHSTENHMIARILWELRGGGAVLGEQLMRDAARIAVNRTVAGVHYPIDTAVGQVLGLTLARYFIRRAKGTGGTKFDAWRFDAERFPGGQDFEFHNFFDPATGAYGREQLDPKFDPPFVDPIASLPPEKSRILEWLWNEALKEWA